MHGKVQSGRSTDKTYVCFGQCSVPTKGSNVGCVGNVGKHFADNGVVKGSTGQCAALTKQAKQIVSKYPDAKLPSYRHPFK